MLQLDLFETTPAVSLAGTFGLMALPGSQPAAAAPPSRHANRTFWRCCDCLSILALEDEDAHAKISCGACTGALEFMGRVERDRLVRDEHRCPCDHRCTDARGPRCDCKCGGKNHGSGLVVRVTVDAGGVPCATPPGSTLTAQRRAEEYRAAVREARARIDARYGRQLQAKRSGEYLSPADYGLYLDGMQEWRHLRAAAAGRVHSNRLKNLARVCK